MKVTVTYRLDDKLRDGIKSISHEAGCPASWTVSQVLEEHLVRRAQRKLREQKLLEQKRIEFEAKEKDEGAQRAECAGCMVLPAASE